MVSTRQVALLRGINIGSRQRVEMARLRELIGELGYGDVRTHLQSGNALFTTVVTPERAAEAIEAQLARHLGLSVRVLVRTRDELTEVVEVNPLGDVATDPSRYLVLFLSAAPDPERLRGLDPAGLEPERFCVRGREIYLWCPNGVHGSRVIPALSDKRIGVTTTARNWNTVTRLLALAGE